jgi:hypothetical protein
VSRSSPPGAKARIDNPALEALSFLIGEWQTTGTHPAVPGETVLGRTVFERHEGGAFLLMRSQVDHILFPDGLAIIASDDVGGRFVMSYFDERGVSRLYEVEVGDGTLTWRRDDPSFSQSTTLTADEGGDRLVGKGRMSKQGGDWADDLSQVFVRERS